GSVGASGRGLRPFQSDGPLEHSLVALDHDLFAEVLLDPSPAGFGINLVDPADGLGRFPRVVIHGYHEARLALGDDLWDRSPGGGDDRSTARHGFGHHQTEWLVPVDREEDGPRP